MKQQLAAILHTALIELCKQHDYVLPENTKIIIEHARDKAHGDYACNIALILAKQLGQNPRELAQKLIDKLEGDCLEKAEVAGPGFINLFMKESSKSEIISQILQQQAEFGQAKARDGEKIILEFVSANPTGPLHVGHGRSAAYGASLANLLRSQGYNVFCEYYVNDAGRQMNILAASVLLRYLEVLDIKLRFPANGYKGNYVKQIAKHLHDEVGSRFIVDQAELFKNLPKDEPEQGCKEKYIDALIERANDCLGAEGFAFIHQFATHAVLDDIKQDLSEFGVQFQNWFSEKSLFEAGSIDKGIRALEKGDYLYKDEGAVWFKSTAFEDEKDRVLKRANGVSTYFASDVAYHWNKYERGFTQLINIFGADHHGYVARVKAAAKALGFDEEAITILLVQFAILYRGKERVQMSTRSGEFVTLRELRREVGNDAARYFYVMRKPNQHMDFDLELAKAKSNENPVYYIQYAHARICRVFETLQEKSLRFDKNFGLEHLASLSDETEQTLLNTLGRYPLTLSNAARDKAPHQVAYYLRELATEFHAYYNAQQFIVDDKQIRNARLCLILAIKQVLQNGLSLIGVSAPEKM